MTPWIIAGMTGAALLTFPITAAAADHEAGVPLSPAEAAGAWTLESAGKSICTLTLGANGSVQAPASCGGVLPVNVKSWEASGDGMKFVSADGQSMAFGRWSNSLFVAHRATGVDVQLKRGGPGA